MKYSSAMALTRATTNLSKLIIRASRGFSSTPANNVQVEVLVSQSSDRLANTALEEWIKRSASFKHRNLLLLSSSLCEHGGRGRNIKACFIHEAEFAGGAMAETMAEEANLVFASIPRDAALRQLPEVCVEAGEGHMMVSVPLEDPEESMVLCTLENIANNFIMKSEGSRTHRRRLSLVRPDGGWFPGIQKIQEDLELNLAEIEAIQAGKKRTGGRA